jgi:hypothetical protein
MLCECESGIGDSILTDIELSKCSLICLALCMRDAVTNFEIFQMITLETTTAS